MDPVLPKLVADACRTLQALASQENAFQRIAAEAVTALRSGGKILTCGNGGSAADAMHLAEELVGRYKNNRRSLPAISLNSDATLLTCIGNDYRIRPSFLPTGRGFGEPERSTDLFLNEREFPEHFARARIRQSPAREISRAAG